MEPATVHIRGGRDRSLRRRHPWVFSGAIDRVEGDPGSGDIVRVVKSDGEFVAWAYFNPRSQIHARVLDWNEDVVINEGWWRERIKRAIAHRGDIPSLGDTDVYRMVHAEADGLPGFIVDRYADFLVIQASTAGVERVKSILVDALMGTLKPTGIFERSDTDSRKLEGLSTIVRAAAGDSPPDRVNVSECGLSFAVDIRSGQKTGFYADQRDNRRAVAEYAEGKDVLDLFSYSGAFSAYALSSGAAHATLIDSSGGALEFAASNFDLNGVDADRYELLQGNVFELARTFRDGGREFDMVVIDPPKLAKSRAGLEKAERAYKDANLLGMKVLKPGGILATFSCSGAVNIEHFTRIITWASVDAGRDVQILRRLSQSADHPVLPSFPESEYLKGLICRVL